LEGKASKEMEVLHMLAQACYKENNLDRAELNFKLSLGKGTEIRE